MRAAPEREPSGPRINEAIRVKDVRLIDETGQNVGVVSHADALARAVAAGLDLVEVSPDADPPVCKILDFGKYKYQTQKKAAEARKHQKIVEIKEIKMRPAIDDHDYDVKMRSIKRFFEEGDKVKVTLRFRGREMAHQQLGMQVLQRVKGDLEPIAKVEVRAAPRRPADGDGAGAAVAARSTRACAAHQGRRLWVAKLARLARRRRLRSVRWRLARRLRGASAQSLGATGAAHPTIDRPAGHRCRRRLAEPLAECRAKPFTQPVAELAPSISPERCAGCRAGPAPVAARAVAAPRAVRFRCEVAPYDQSCREAGAPDGGGDDARVQVRPRHLLRALRRGRRLHDPHLREAAIALIRARCGACPTRRPPL